MDLRARQPERTVSISPAAAARRGPWLAALITDFGTYYLAGAPVFGLAGIVRKSLLAGVALVPPIPEALMLVAGYGLAALIPIVLGQRLREGNGRALWIFFASQSLFGVIAVGWAYLLWSLTGGLIVGGLTAAWFAILYARVLQPFRMGQEWRKREFAGIRAVKGPLRPSVFFGNRTGDVWGLEAVKVAAYFLIAGAFAGPIDAGLEFLADAFGLAYMPELHRATETERFSGCGMSLDSPICPSDIFDLRNPRQDSVWLSIALLMTTVAALGLGAWVRSRLARRMKRLAAMRFDQLPKRDARTPNLFLRSFDDDDLWVEENFRWWHLIYRYFKWDRAIRIEELVADSFWPSGPLIAIGRPGENLPEEGAVRDYVDDAHWKDKVKAMAAASRSVIMIAAHSAGVLWELETMHAEGHREKLTLLIPPVPDEVQFVDRWYEFRDRSGLAQLPREPRAENGENILALVFGDEETVVITGAKRDELHYREALNAAVVLSS